MWECMNDLEQEIMKRVYEFLTNEERKNRSRKGNRKRKR